MFRTLVLLALVSLTLAATLREKALFLEELETALEREEAQELEGRNYGRCMSETGDCSDNGDCKFINGNWVCVCDDPDTYSGSECEIVSTGSRGFDAMLRDLMDMLKTRMETKNTGIQGQ